MNNAEIAAALVAKLNEAAAASGARAALVSVAIEMLHAGAIASIETKIDRATRTLLFMGAEAYGPDRMRVASATSVHRIIAEKP